jgi:exopolysaccharide biosynthesis polyprenyl glycosylphosphotransferase
MAEKTNLHFELSERKLLLRFLDVSLVLLGLHFVGSVFEFDYFTIREDKWIWSLLLGFYILFFGSIFEIYHLKKSSDFFKILKGIVATSSITLLVYILTPFFSPELPESRIQIIYFYMSIIISMSIGRLAYILLINSPIFKKSVLLIADGELFNEIENDLAIADANYKIEYFINTNNDSKEAHTDKQISSSELKEFAQKGVHEIVVTRNSKFSSSELYSDLLDLFNKGQVIKEYSEVYEELSGRVYVSFKDKDFYKQFPFSQHKVKPLYRLVHRFFDVLISIVGLLCLLLMIPFLTIINMMANKGPLFYTQERVGKKGKLFKIFKLRSMVVNAEKDGAVWADKNDSRVTAFGKFLRKTRLDEFPQFINILKGEMSVIGPRPERPIFVNQLAKEIPFYPTRHIVKPGLTGWAQVNTSYGASIDESLLKLQYDLYYIKHRNIFLDLNIVIKTLSTVLFFRGQ